METLRIIIWRNDYLKQTQDFKNKKKKKTIDYLNETLDDTYSLNKLDQ